MLEDGNAAMQSYATFHNRVMRRFTNGLKAFEFQSFLSTKLTQKSENFYYFRSGGFFHDKYECLCFFLLIDQKFEITYKE